MNSGAKQAIASMRGGSSANTKESSPSPELCCLPLCFCAHDRFRLLHAFRHQLCKCGGHSNAGEQNAVPKERVSVLGILSVQQWKWKQPTENLHPGVHCRPPRRGFNPTERNTRYSIHSLTVWMQVRFLQLLWLLAAEQGVKISTFNRTYLPYL